MGRTRQGHARSRLAHCKTQQEQAHQGIETDMCSMNLESSVTVAQIDDFEDVIDVRSPGEYALDHVPGAVSHPVLGDEERAQAAVELVRLSALYPSPLRRLARRHAVARRGARGTVKPRRCLPPCLSTTKHHLSLCHWSASAGLFLMSSSGTTTKGSNGVSVRRK